MTFMNNFIESESANMKKFLHLISVVIVNVRFLVYYIHVYYLRIFTYCKDILQSALSMRIQSSV